MPGQISKALFVLVVVLLGIYAMGSGGIFFMDDGPSMDGMLAVNDWSSAASYLFGGTSGPLGRPVALATFLMQRDAYPESAAPFLWFNVLIHVANVLLLWALVRRMQRQLPRVLSGSNWLAPAVAFLWGVLPILASASLMVVQRMTTLSAMFVLMGMHAYLWSRTAAVEGRWAGLAAGVTAVGLCTVLATLSKENGVLLPLLLLVMHRLLFGVSTARGETMSGSLPMLRALSLCLWLPSLMVLGYLVSWVPTIAGTYANRPFSLPERLASETVILWEYLRVAFLPRLADLSPFRDDYPIRQFSDGMVQLALVAWVAVLVLAFVLRRRGQPLLLFALAWYLVGHFLESGMFALFLYFEHRNYVPLMGPVLAMVTLFCNWVAVPGRVRMLAGGAYGMFMAFTLWQAASMWGQRQQLVWAQAHLDSPRALQMLAGAYMQVGRVKEVDALYEGAIRRNPRLTSVATQGLRASCYLRDEGEATRRWLTHARQSLSAGWHSHLVVGSLDAVARLQMQGQCAGLAPSDIVALADLVQRNPAFGGHHDRQGLSALRANVLLASGDVPGAMVQMRQALRALPDIETVKALRELTLQTQGREAAAAFLSEARRLSPPGNKLAQRQWLRELDALDAR